MQRSLRLSQKSNNNSGNISYSTAKISKTEIDKVKLRTPSPLQMEHPSYRFTAVTSNQITDSNSNNIDHNH